MKKKLNIFKTFKRESHSLTNSQSSPALTQHRGNRDTSSATSDVGSDIQTPTSTDFNDVHSDSSVTIQLGRRNLVSSSSDSNLEHSGNSNVSGNGSQRRIISSPLTRNHMSSSDLPTNGKVYKSGILKKEGKKMRSWKKRHFQLFNDGIYCSKTKSSAGTENPITGKIALDKFTIVSIVSDKKKYAFQVSNQKKSYYLRAGSESERDDWISSIREVIDQLGSNNSAGLGVAVGSANSTDTSATPSDKRHSPLRATLPVHKEATDEEYEVNSDEDENEEDENEEDEDDEDDDEEEEESEDSRTGGSTNSSSMIALEESQQINRVTSLKMARLFSDSTSLTSPTSPMDEQQHSSSSNSLNNELRKQVSSTDIISPKNHGFNTTNSCSPASANNMVMLSIEDEYDIAISAAQIFMKNEEDRTPEEQAYVLAMKQYTNVLMAHCCKHRVKPEYSLASGTAIFVVPEDLRSFVEKEYVADICNETITQMELVQRMKEKNCTNAAATMSHGTKMKELPMEHQIEIARRAHEILDKPHHLRTNEEQEYVNQLRSVLVDVSRLEKEHGLNLQYSYGLSSTIMLAKYEQERTMQDWEFWSATAPQK